MRATDKQIWYLRKLLHQAFSLGIHTPGFDVHHLERTTREEASREIERIKGLIPAREAELAAQRKAYLK